MLDPRWTGTDFDRREMRTLKLEQVVRVSLIPSNQTFAISICAALALLTTDAAQLWTISVALLNGGTAGLFWNYFIAAFGLIPVYASIAELSSMIPTAGGQYFWVAVLAPRSCRRYLSYITGWLCAITWQTGVAGSTYFTATIIQGLFVLNIETYDYKRWHGTLLTFVFIIIAIIFNTVLAKRLPMVEGLFVIFHVIGIVIFIPVLVLSKKAQGSSPLTEFYNPGGWASNGLATMIGSAAPLTALIGFDCSVHMSEETKDSSRTVPVTLLFGYFSNVFLGLFVLLACIYTIGPLDQALAASTGYPILNLFYDSTNSLAATNVMTFVLIFNFTASGIASLAAASRQLWSFARSHGVPFSRFIAPAHLKYDIPLNAVFCSLILAVLIALVNIGTAQALGILVSMFNSALLASYGITIACVLLHRLQGRRLPNSRFSLGKWGILTNVVALVYITPLFLFSFFPGTPNPTPNAMNWAIVMAGGVIVLATVYYIIWGRKTYTPPNETIEDYMERYEATTASSEKAEGSSAVEEIAESKQLD